MKPITTLGMAIALSAVLAAPGLAVVSSEQAREANAGNAAPTATALGAPNSPGPAGSNTGEQMPPAGMTVGPGSVNHEANRPLGYGKGAAENSSVGKDDGDSQRGANQPGSNDQLGTRPRNSDPETTSANCAGTC